MCSAVVVGLEGIGSDILELCGLHHVKIGVWEDGGAVVGNPRRRCQSSQDQGSKYRTKYRTLVNQLTSGISYQDQEHKVSTRGLRISTTSKSGVNEFKPLEIHLGEIEQHLLLSPAYLTPAAQIPCIEEARPE